MTFQGRHRQSPARATIRHWPIRARSQKSLRHHRGPVADPGVPDPITCPFQWVDGTPDTVKPAATGACSAAHTYAAGGVFVVTITASDDGASVFRTFASFVVTDPNAGLLTGGGWTQDPSGRANFSFEIKSDDDDSELNFQSRNLRFRSTAHQWLVIAGARPKAKGAGKCNGASGYIYLLSVVDGKITGGGVVDEFRIKIWKNATATTPRALIYDSVPTAPDTFDAAYPQPLGGGNITIHPKESKEKKDCQRVEMWVRLRPSAAGPTQQIRTAWRSPATTVHLDRNRQWNRAIGYVTRADY